jgi:hypothetical protein
MPTLFACLSCEEVAHSADRARNGMLLSNGCKQYWRIKNANSFDVWDVSAHKLDHVGSRLASKFGLPSAGSARSIHTVN